MLRKAGGSSSVNRNRNSSEEHRVSMTYLRPLSSRPVAFWLPCFTYAQPMVLYAENRCSTAVAKHASPRARPFPIGDIIGYRPKPVVYMYKYGDGPTKRSLCIVRLSNAFHAALCLLHPLRLRRTNTAETKILLLPIPGERSDEQDVTHPLFYDTSPLFMHVNHTIFCLCS